MLITTVTPPIISRCQKYRKPRPSTFVLESTLRAPFYYAIKGKGKLFLKTLPSPQIRVRRAFGLV